MEDGAARRLTIICCLFVSAAAVGCAWMRSDLVSGSTGLVFGKLLIVNLAAGAAAAVMLLRWQHRLRKSADNLESFVTALPGSETIPVEDNSPAELGNIERALKAMAQRSRLAVERGNLELARRDTILACMAEGVLAVDNALRVIFCNDAFAKAFNTRVPAEEGRILYEVVREPMIRDILERVVKSGHPETDRLRLPSAAGRRFEANALSFGEQPRRGAIIVLRDITDIERQEQVRKDFVADVSHELRTPLAAIRGYAETLLDGGLEDRENNRKFVEIIQSHAIRLNNIASDLLAISELDSNVPPPVPAERLALVTIIESAVHTVEGSASMRGVELETSNCRSCTVYGYRFRLEQALTNLLDNAVKFNRPQGKVTVACEPTDNSMVRISIADTGIGIPSEELRRIFERFYRVDKARARPAGGTGLGLPIVKEVVEGMGGTVTVESQLGRGSTFTILLKEA